MKAKLNNRYELDILNPAPLSGDMELKFVFSSKTHPRMIDFLNDVAMHRKSVDYEDASQMHQILIVGYSSAVTDFLAEDIRGADIALREETYGPEASQLAPEHRREFVMTHHYGTMKIKVID